MDAQKREAKELAKHLPLKKKIEHIWLYYKWWIIGAVIVAMLIAHTIYTVVTRLSYDMEMALYTQEYVSETKIAALEEYFSAFVPDVDGDGEKTVAVHAISVGLIGEEEGYAAVRTKISMELLTGAYPVFLVDDEFYEFLQLEGYQGAIESFREMNVLPEVCEILGIPDGKNLYWGTAIPYNDDANATHDMAVEVEKQLFGERE